MSLPIALVIIIALIGVLYIQAVVTTNEKKWLILVFPIISFIASTVVALITNPMETLGLTIIYKIVIFLLCNIFTVVLFMVSFSRKYGFKRS